MLATTLLSPVHMAMFSSLRNSQMPYLEKLSAIQTTWSKAGWCRPFVVSFHACQITVICTEIFGKYFSSSIEGWIHLKSICLPVGETTECILGLSQCQKVLGLPMLSFMSAWWESTCHVRGLDWFLLSNSYSYAWIVLFSRTACSAFKKSIVVTQSSV